MGWRARTPRKRAKAEQGLTEVTDPRAVPMIWALFVRGGERQQVAAVQMLGQIDGPSASNGLAVLAVFSPSGEVRRRAIETLTRRDPRDVVGRLIGSASQAVQVSGASRQWAGIAGRTLRRRGAVQYPALLSKPHTDLRARIWAASTRRMFLLTPSASGTSSWRQFPAMSQARSRGLR